MESLLESMNELDLAPVQKRKVSFLLDERDDGYTSDTDERRDTKTEDQVYALWQKKKYVAYFREYLYTYDDVIYLMVHHWSGQERERVFLSMLESGICDTRLVELFLEHGVNPEIGVAPCLAQRRYMDLNLLYAYGAKLRRSHLETVIEENDTGGVMFYLRRGFSLSADEMERVGSSRVARLSRLHASAHLTKRDIRFY